MSNFREYYKSKAHSRSDVSLITIHLYCIPSAYSSPIFCIAGWKGRSESVMYANIRQGQQSNW